LYIALFFSGQLHTPVPGCCTFVAACRCAPDDSAGSSGSDIDTKVQQQQPPPAAAAVELV
jgi:hypothetical protein